MVLTLYITQNQSVCNRRDVHINVKEHIDRNVKGVSILSNNSYIFVGKRRYSPKEKYRKLRQDVRLSLCITFSNRAL